ncbi:hypothetical protein Sme01_08090 [Sphaerisporangium melleum]|uniref:Uncharacterized protein n=1 Tax=Sphaerisporangium melleum TaxID=321316 RepID=A0A917VFZ6_9ACTN|nr:hypothetical protein [Sphaerisporangium melleum]GGK72491.1 hypothetical protein GCM10007964_14100 [Sphaerisporangium melleum]GII68333.1 hypothetical protein Sme01_08090 [Sphaerisporangium melleum]
MLHLRHRWETIETIGRVVTQRCAVCGRTRVRVLRSPSPPSDLSGHARPPRAGPVSFRALAAPGGRAPALAAAA